MRSRGSTSAKGVERSTHASTTRRERLRPRATTGGPTYGVRDSTLTNACSASSSRSIETVCVSSVSTRPRMLLRTLAHCGRTPRRSGSPCGCRRTTTLDPVGRSIHVGNRSNAARCRATHFRPNACGRVLPRVQLRLMLPQLVGYLAGAAVPLGTSNLDDTLDALRPHIHAYGQRRQLTFEERVTEKRRRA